MHYLPETTEAIQMNEDEAAAADRTPATPN
jgi:hypothetical protein